MNGEKITPMEGTSLAPAFSGKSLQRGTPIFWEHEGNRAVRDGQWKLVAKENKPWELYDMSKDRSELNDLAEKMPARVEQMAASWDAWAERSMVLPLGAWRGKVSFNRKQKRFELKVGADLGQDAAPYVEKKQIAILVSLEKPGSQGVIVAQGGTAHGYSLYLRDGLLELATRHSGKLTVLTAKKPLADEAVEIAVQLARDGSVRVTAGTALVIEGKVPGMMVSMPQDGLQVGRDANGAVGRYEAPAVFDGQIKAVVIELAK